MCSFTWARILFINKASLYRIPLTNFAWPPEACSMASLAAKKSNELKYYFKPKDFLIRDDEINKFMKADKKRKISFSKASLSSLVSPSESTFTCPDDCRY